MQHKSKKIFSELSTFFKNNDNSDAIFSVSRVLEGLRFSTRDLGYEKRHNCKLTALQALHLLILFPFFCIGNAFNYSCSALGKLFSCNKDMFYNLMKQDCIDWRRLVYRISMGLIRRLEVRADSRGKNAGPVCLVIDDTDFPKTGRHAEMLGRVFSHVAMRSILGFKGLFMGRTDGKTLTMLDCSLHGEMGKNPNKPQGISKKAASERYARQRDMDSPAQARKAECLTSKIATAVSMVKRAIKQGVKFDYLLVDSWFTCAELVLLITSRHIKCHLLGMVKMGNTRYTVDGKDMTAKAIIDRQRKRKQLKHSRKLGCHYCTVDAVFAGRKVRLFFYRFGKSDKWRGLLSTDTSLNALKAYQIYALRWSIEVCFHECKSLLGLGKCQCRDFSSQIAAMSVVMIQYNVLAFVKRFEAYETIGGLFKQVSAQTLELTIAERIWQLMTEVLVSISELVDMDTDQLLEVIITENDKISNLVAALTCQEAA